MNGSNGKNTGRSPTGYDHAWALAAKEIASRDLSGLRVRCPSCHRNGSLISKWTRGVSVKPLYVVHANGNGHFKACLLKDTETQVARERIHITESDIRKTLRLGKAFVLFSGGRDSVCTLKYLHRIASQSGIEITALHADTTAGFREVEEYVQGVCRLLNIPLVTVRPPYDYFELAKRWGIPGVKSRWCCETLKIAPIRRFLATIQEPKVIYDGIRAEESYLRATYVPIWFHPSFRAVSVSPIFSWTGTRVDQYIRRNSLPPNPTADLGTSGECWCGAYKCRADFEGLLEVHPEIFDKLVEVEKAQRGRFTFIFEKGKQVPLHSLRTNAKGK